MTDHDFAQAVMKAAGVGKVQKDFCAWCRDSRKMHECGGACGVVGCSCQGYVASYHYPDPLTTAEGFLALWDALEYSGHYLTFQSRDAGCKVTIGVGVGKNGRTSHVVGKSQNKDRKAALVEAAGRALGVTR